MAPATRKNDPDAPPGGERQPELEAQHTQLRAEITAVQANNQAQRQLPLESKARVFRAACRSSRGSATTMCASGSS
ncbi:hypothetical protein DVH05_006358 [Phytophthora capsici]|nr:hypothetical protein DVH05_006358 [Phytophthora capsici]